MLSTLFPHRKTIIFEKKSALLQGSSRAWFGRFHVIGAHFLLNKHIQQQIMQETAEFMQHEEYLKDFLPYKVCHYTQYLIAKVVSQNVSKSLLINSFRSLPGLQTENIKYAFSAPDWIIDVDKFNNKHKYLSPWFKTVARVYSSQYQYDAFIRSSNYFY